MNAFNLSPAKMFWMQVAIIALLATGHVLGMATLSGGDRVAEKFYHQYLDMNGEGTPAAYFSALSLLAIGLVAAHLANSSDERATRRFWTIVSCLLVYCSVDEAASIHEGFAVIGKLFFPQDGIFYYSWWAPFLVVLAPVLVLIAPGALALDKSTRNGLFLAALVFLTGALGLELVEATVAEQIAAAVEGSAAYNLLRERFWVLVLLEECLEMLAAALALRVLLRRAAEVAPAINIRVAETVVPTSSYARRHMSASRLEPRPPTS